MISQKKYSNYFRSHYKYSFAANDLKKHHDWFFSQWKFINKQVDLNVSKSVLEIGSSIGGFIQFLDSRGIKNIVGIDMDKEAVGFAKKIFPMYTFINSSIEKLNFKTNYDYIFGFEVLEHLENPIFSISKIHKLLKKNGMFIGTSPFPYYKNIYADSTHTYVLHPSNWYKLFFEAGFSEISIYPMTYFPLLWRLSRRLNIRLPIYLPFKYFISTTLIIAKK